MKIENEVLIIDDVLRDEDVEEFSTALSQEQIKKVVIENDDISSSIVQALWCKSKEKEIEVESEFLKLFFENVMVGENS